ncbi:MAG TPA: RNA 2',3'-cyclic phosphodiesterase [Peptococcaceae bacterium]|nr:RNA 2',3'-cyclic phosphodiesterase [Peptococcaceae bacterium]
MRLFIAINLSESLKDEIASIMQNLKSFALQGNFTRRENLHLTLAFLGEVAPTRIESIKQAMDKVSGGQFTLSIRELGHFPRSGGDIYWLGVEKNSSLLKLHTELCRELKAAGFKLEGRGFKPHLTLGRQIVLRTAFDQAEFSSKIPPLFQEVDRISLMKSERPDGILTYTEIYSKYL